MKIFRKNPIAAVLAILSVSLALGLTGPIAAFAATSPTLVGASSYSVVAGSIVTNTGATSISGNVGISPSIGVLPHYHESGATTYGVGSSLHDADGAAATAQADNTAAYGALSAGPNAVCTDPLYQFGTGDIDLAGKSLVPGVYCADTFSLSGTLTLNDTGAPGGVWIFRSAATLITSSGIGAKVQFLNGIGLPCNVWWKVVSSATIGVGTTFIGNILASTSVALQTGATLNGRAMAQTAAVTLDTNTISGPTCAAVPLGSASQPGTIHVIKTVINDNGGTKTITDFPLFVNGVPIGFGIGNIYKAPGDVFTFTVTETPDPNYTHSFSGDCDVNGQLNLSPNSNKICFITNNDIGAPVIVPPVPPLIDVVKVPSPLALPTGPGPVTYNYTLRNIGTVPVTDITMVDDTCGPTVLVSGDTNADKKLDMTETWKYTCVTMLSATHTNTVTATGWANGISTTDIASATVVVGLPLVPPLIHVTKIPSPLALPNGEGMVTYTEKITNPGTVALSNVHLTDDKCGPMKYISGDANINLKLESTETWTYTCQTNLTQTTTNTATATGEANGFTVRDLAIATVVVATPVMHPAAPVVPKLPRTGVAPLEESIPWNIVMLSGIFAVAILLNANRKKQRN